MADREKKPALCGVCPGGCAVEVTLEEGRLVGIAPLKNAPYGGLCVRGAAAPEVVYSPHRLKTPLVRTGERGEGKFRSASWDEALDLVAEKIFRIRDIYGPQALISHSGRGAFEQSLLEFNNARDGVSSKLFLPLGSPNTAGVGSLCFVSYGVLAPIPTFGLRGPQLSPDVEESKLIVVWGANPATDSPPTMYHRILNAQRAGAKVVAIDHRKSEIALRADRFVPIRPGTDGALALGMLRVLIDEELYDKEFVASWTVGFDELKAYVAEFPPERVEKITGVPAATVVALAREIATTEHTTLRTYTGLEYTTSGVQNIRAVFLLWALAGHLDVPGGLHITLPPRLPLEKVPVPEPEGILPIGAKEYPLFHELLGTAQFLALPDAVLKGKPYPVKGLLNNGASILTSYPQPALWEETFRNLDLFVVIDRFLTRDALFADVVLPATTEFENLSYQRYPDYVRLRRRVVEPVGEARNHLMILAALAKRLGWGHLYPQSEEELLEKAFAKSPELLEELRRATDGVALPAPELKYRKYETGHLRRDGKPGFETPSGKVEIASSILARHGYDPLPVYREPTEGPLESPELLGEYPLVLNTGARIQSTFRSQHLNIPGLLKLQEKPHVLVNPIDAGARGIRAGERVQVRTRRGSVPFYADVTDRVPPGTVEVNQGGGGGPSQAQAWREANTNILTDFENRDPISGFPVFKALLCQVEKG